MSSKQNSNYIILAIVLAVVLVAAILFFNKNTNLADENVAGEAGKSGRSGRVTVGLGGSCRGDGDCSSRVRINGVLTPLNCYSRQCLPGPRVVPEGGVCVDSLQCVVGTACSNGNVCVGSPPSSGSVPSSTGGPSRGRTYQN